MAELQFRLACTVNLAVANEVQTLDVPVLWVFGRHAVSYQDFGLRRDQADYAAAQLEMTATLVVASAIRDVVVEAFPNARNHADPNVVSAYQISRLIRNAFAHSMIEPKWSIDDDCQNKVFEIEKVIRLDTSALDGAHLDWRHYGGPLAIFYLCRYAREVLLQVPINANRKKPPHPILQCYQQGRLILRRIVEIPADAVEVASVKSGEWLQLGEGHRIAGPVAAYERKQGTETGG
jgi:hypothetical protein